MVEGTLCADPVAGVAHVRCRDHRGAMAEEHPLTTAGDAADDRDNSGEEPARVIPLVWKRPKVVALMFAAACAAGLAVTIRGHRDARAPGNADADGVVELNGGARGPFGEYAGPVLNPWDYHLGAVPKYADWRAHMGSAPKPTQKPSEKCLAGCTGTCCNKGKLCCGSDAVCCGTSCCSGGSICCDEKIGLCCAGGTMCCWGMMCCAPGWACGHTRGNVGLFVPLKQCGSGAQFRRLSDEQRYKHNIRRLLANETALKELVGAAEEEEEHV